MRKRLYSRDYEQELLEKLREEYLIPDEALVDHLLAWMNSDDSCQALEDFCRENDIPYEKEDEEDE